MQFNEQFNASNPGLLNGASLKFSFDGVDLNSMCSINKKVIYNTYIEDLIVDIDGDIISDVNDNPIGIIRHSANEYIDQKQGSGIALQTMNALDINNITVEAWESSLSNGGGVIDKRYGNKTLTLAFFIQGDSHDDLVSRIQELKKGTQGIEKDFALTVGGIKRTYTATVTRFTVPSFSKLDDFVEGVQVDFLITSPFWVGDIVSTVDTITGDIEKVISNDGDTDCLPRLLFLAKDTTSVSAITIGTRAITDLITYDITLITAIVPGDLVEFDWKEKTVKKNGVELPFSGVFMPLTIGFNVYELDFTGTANFDVYFFYNPVYL